MYRSVIITLSTMLLFLLLLTGAFLFLFSPTGDELSKPYLKELIEEKSGLPVEIKTYRLRAGVLEVDLVLNRQLELKTTAHYDLLDRTFEGVYRIKAKDFHYENLKLSEADIRGRYKGVAEDIRIEGRGTVLHAPVVYKLRLVNNEPQQIEAMLRDAALEEVLALLSQPPMAKGKIDMDIEMPRIGTENAKGSAHLVLKKAYLDRTLIKQQYGIVLPKTSLLLAKAVAELDGQKITFDALGKSKLFSFALKEGVYHLDDKILKSRYIADIKEMRLFSQNRLSGPLHVEGEIKGKDDHLKLKGESRSFGGVLRFEKSDQIKISMNALSLGKVLHFVRQPAYASGVLDGEITLADSTLKKGHYRLDLKQGALNANVVGKRFGYKIPQKNTLKLQSVGEIMHEKLHAKVRLDSTLANVVLEPLVYDLKTEQLKTPYHLVLYDPESIGKARQPRKGKVVVIDGKLGYAAKGFSVNGKAKGLGKKAVFSYNGDQAELNAAGIYIGRVLALAGLPSYLNGTVNAEVKLSDISQMNGTFSFKGSDLVTEPSVMKSLLGSPAKIKLSVSAQGVMKQHISYAKVSAKTPLGSISLKNLVSDLKRDTLTAQYHVNIPDLQKLMLISDIRLFGHVALDGTIDLKKVLTVTGKTLSLGGKVTYKLVGNRFAAHVQAVPLPNILKLAGYPQSFLGSVSGKMAYNLKTRKGTADFNIASFQIKPNDLTRMLTPILKKDPSRIIFKSTTFHAKMNKDIVTYRLIAKGTRSVIEITEGWVNQKSKRQKAKVKIVYEKYTVYGTVGGTTEHPKIHLDTSRIIQEKLQNKLQKQLEKKWGKEAGALLRGLGL